MPPLLPIYLRSLRKRWGLSQAELSHLLGIDETALSKVENRSRWPSVELMLGIEVVFGETARAVFPALYEEIEEDIMARAKALYAELEIEPSAADREKLRLLTEMIERADPLQP